MYQTLIVAGVAMVKKKERERERQRVSRPGFCLQKD